MEHTQSIPLDIVLPKYIKAEINGLIETFVKGITWKTGKETEYDINLGEVTVSTEILYDDTTKFNIICMHVSRYYNRISMEAVFERTRQRDVLEVRQMIFVLLSKFTGWSSGRIGQNTGGFDHATVLHGIKVIKNLVSTYQDYALAYGTLCSRIRDSIIRYEGQKKNIDTHQM